MARQRRFQLPDETATAAAADPEHVATFVQGAPRETGENPGAPWAGLDPKAKPTSGINLRLNEYQITLLRYVAEHGGLSQQQTTKRILIPALEARAREIADNQPSG